MRNARKQSSVRGCDDRRQLRLPCSGGRSMARRFESFGRITDYVGQSLELRLASVQALFFDHIARKNVSPIALLAPGRSVLSSVGKRFEIESEERAGSR